MASKKSSLDSLYIMSYQDLMIPREQDPAGELAVIENPEPHRIYDIEFTCPEWTAVCPKTGFPDFATIKIKYQPRKACIELKSLKMYINAYRNLGIYHEAVVNKIMTDIIEVTSPWKIEVIGDFNVRGNIHTLITTQFRAPDYPESSHS